MSRWIEFFEDQDKALSMSRLLCFLSFFPAAYVVIATLSEGNLGWFLGAFGGVYVGGKIGDALNKPTIVASTTTVTTQPKEGTE